MFLVARSRLTAVPVVAALALLTSSCVDSRTAPPPPVVQITAADLEGTWRGWAGSSVTFEPTGTAQVVRLDGQEFRFDDNWRMTGTGSWELHEPGRYRGGNTVGRGFVVRLSVTSEPGAAPTGGAATAVPAPPAPTRGTPVPTAPSSSGVDEREAADRTAPVPARGTWDLGVTRDREGRTLLYFLTSDPDNRDTYYLSKSGERPRDGS